MKKLYLFVAFTWLTQLAYMQAWFPFSTSLSAGVTSVTDTSRPALYQNPALGATYKVPYLHAVYDSRFDITELATKGLRFAYPFSHFHTTIDFRYSGFNAYHELVGGIGFSRNFGDRFSMGLQLMLEAHYAIESDRYYWALYPQWGVTIPLSKQLMMGVAVLNPFRAGMNYEAGRRDLPSVYSLGIKMQMSEQLCWRVQADQEISNRLRWGTAFEFRMLEQLTVQAGVHYIDFFVPALGAGFCIHQLQFDLLATLHPQLGTTLTGGLSFYLTK